MAYTGKLTRETILREAQALLAEGGIEAVSLRRIAERLDASAPSLARHVGDKGQLLSLLSAAIFLQAVDLIPPGLSGDAWLEAFGRALRAKQQETRDIAALISIAPPVKEAETQVRDRLQRAMTEAGLEGQRAQLEQAAIQALVTGWMTFEKSARGPNFAARQLGDDAFGESLRALIAGFAVERRRPE